jgi:hypothetical protein
MNLKTAYDFTLKRLIFGDMILNWFLGIVLTLLPGLADRVLGQANLLPFIVYRIIGIIFLGFAAWQTSLVVRGRCGPFDLYFAAAMAEGPVVLLTAALLFMSLALRPVARVVLWIGDIYMLFLGGWYIFVANSLRRTPPVDSP